MTDLKTSAVSVAGAGPDERVTAFQCPVPRCPINRERGPARGNRRAAASGTPPLARSAAAGPSGPAAA